jgi:hypothetical protein
MRSIFDTYKHHHNSIDKHQACITPLASQKVRLAQEPHWFFIIEKNGTLPFYILVIIVRLQVSTGVYRTYVVATPCDIVTFRPHHCETSDIVMVTAI